MSVKLNNHAHFLKQEGKYNWYDWVVFVDEDEQELQKIDHVTYFLHDTFPEPVRVVSTRENKFALKSRGWGEFNLAARVAYRDGRVDTVVYPLDLSKA